MKKFNVILSLIMVVLMTTACNQSLGLGNFNYEKIHCFKTNECYTIIKWYDDSTGVEVKTEEYGSIFFSEGTYILVEETCPICKK